MSNTPTLFRCLALVVALLTITATLAPVAIAAPNGSTDSRIDSSEGWSLQPQGTDADSPPPGTSNRGSPAAGASEGTHPTDGTTSEPRPTPTVGEQWPPSSTNETANGTVSNVTLVTGQTVVVHETDGERQYTVDADVDMRTLETPRGTYIYPAALDFETFDRELFNVDLLLAQNLTDDQRDSIPVIVESTRGPQPKGASAAITIASEVSAIKGGVTLETIGAQAGEIGKADAARAARQLRTNPRVDAVHLDVRYRVQLDDAASIVNAEQTRANYDVDGSNVTVAVLDTGIDETHPDIDQVVAAKDFTGDGTTKDLQGHGTHVAGIVAGNGNASNGTYTGIAPNASLINGRVLDEYGYGYTSNIINGMEWATDQGADVISMSLGGTSTKLRSNDPYTDAVEYATGNGTAVVIAAGNDGARYTIGTPGVAEDAITVGSTNKNGDLSYFSSRGPTPQGHFLKPTVVAPGSDVMSTASSQAGNTELYVEKSGTSMATPVVAGVVALVKDEHPDWSADRLKAAVTSTADPLDGETPYDQGAGLVDASDAIDPAVVIDEPVVDFGTLSGPGPHERVVTISNPRNESVAVNLSASASNFDGDPAPASTNVSSITLAPGDSTDVAIRVNASVPMGMYAGRLTVDGGEYSAVFGFERVANVTITKHAFPGGSVDGDSVGLIANDSTAPSDRVFSSEFTGDTVSFQVPDNGSYQVYSSGETADGDFVVVTKSIELDGDATVVLNESNTTRVRLDTSAISNRTGDLLIRDFSQNVELHLETDTYTLGFHDGAAPDTDYYVPEKGVVSVPMHGAFVPVNDTDDTAEDFDTPRWYSLGGTITDVRSQSAVTVDPDNLRTLSVTYRRTHPDQTLRGLFTPQLGSSGSMTILSGGKVGDRVEQDIHYTLRYEDAGFQAVGAATTDWWIESIHDTPNDVPSTENRTHDPLSHPFIGTHQVSLHDTYDELIVDLIAQQSGERTTYFYADADPDLYRIYVDGVLEEEWKTTNPPTDRWVNYDENGDPYRIYIEGENDETTLSTRTVTNVTAEIHESGDSTAPVIEDVDVVGLNETNTAPNGNVTIEATITDPGTSTVSEVVVLVSTGNESSTPTWTGGPGEWTAVTATKVPGTDDRYRVRTDLGRTTENLDLAVFARNSIGYETRTTVFDAVALADLPPLLQMDVNASVRGDRLAVPYNTSVQLTSENSTDNFGIDSYEWSVKGQTVTGPTANVTYESIGEKTVTLKATDTAGQTATITRTIRVIDVEPPEAALTRTGPSNVTVNDTTISFDASDSTDDVGITEYRWDVNDDGTYEAITASPTLDHTYLVAGTHTPRVAVVDEGGNVENATVDPITVSDDSAPNAGLTTTPSTVNVSRAVTISAAGSSDNGAIDHYEFALGNGTTRTTTNATIDAFYQEPGTYTVTVTVVDTAGQTDQTTATVTVVDELPPTVAYELDDGDGTVTVNTTTVLSANATTDNYQIAAYHWDFDADGTIDETTTDPTTTTNYTTMGSQDVRLTVEDTKGNNASRTKTVEVVDDLDPVAKATSNRSEIYPGDSIRVDATNSTDNTKIDSYTWYLPNGSTQTGPVITVTLNNPGYQYVYVVVEDAHGNREYAWTGVDVIDQTDPTVTYTLPTNNTTYGQTLAPENFTYDDNYGVWTVEADLDGDGTYTTLYNQDPVVDADWIGTRTVSVRVTDYDGNIAYANETLTVVDETPPVADVTVNASSVETGQPVRFDATGSTDAHRIDSYEWDLDGDDQPEATGPTITHAFDDAGTHNVTVTVTDPSGNSASESVTVDVQSGNDDGDDGDDGGGGGGGGGGGTGGGDDPRFGVTSIELNTTDVEVGDTVTVTATYVNEYDTSRAREATLKVGGEPVTGRPITLVANSQIPVNFTYTFEEPGTTRIQVDYTTYGFVNVDGDDDTAETTSEPATTNPTADPTATTTDAPKTDTSTTADTVGPTTQPDDETPGFGVLPAVAALLAALAIAARRLD